MTKLYHINLIEVNNMELLYGVLSGLITAFLIYIVSRLFKHHRHLNLLFNKYRYYYRDIRFSIAYLYRIKIDDQYLLIKGNRIEQFQPIGGVYKYYESFLRLKELYDVKSDNPQNFCEGNDLRIIVRGKNILNIIDWFNTRKNREVTIYREFYEELIKCEIIDLGSLVRSNIEFIKQIEPTVKYSSHFKMQEILIFEVYELHLADQDIRQIKASLSNDKLILVDMDSIKREHIRINGKDCKIGAHSKYIL